MHCPENINGREYISMVAATAMLLSNGLNDFDIFVLAEFLGAVSSQLYTLGAFKAFEQAHRKPPQPPKK